MSPWLWAIIPAGVIVGASLVFTLFLLLLIGGLIGWGVAGGGL